MNKIQLIVLSVLTVGFGLTLYGVVVDSSVFTLSGATVMFGTMLWFLLTMIGGEDKSQFVTQYHLLSVLEQLAETDKLIIDRVDAHHKVLELHTKALEVLGDKVFPVKSKDFTDALRRSQN